jgi:uncharacterized membrane protein YjdF
MMYYTRIISGIGMDKVFQRRRKRDMRKIVPDRIEKWIWCLYVLVTAGGAVYNLFRRDWPFVIMAMVTLSMFFFVVIYSRRLEKMVGPALRYGVIAVTVAIGIKVLSLRDWDALANALLTIVLFAWPLLLKEKKRLSFPPEFLIVIYTFIFASMFLGEVQHFYYRYGFWDVIVHFTSAPFFGYTGFLMVYAMNHDRNVHSRLSPFMISLYAFCFSMLIGVVWELFEYGVDALLGGDMQKARHLEYLYGYFDTRLGLLDTMQDLVVDALGALTVSGLGYYYLTRVKSKGSGFFRLKDVFIEENPELFR